VLRAATEEYAERGWAGLTMDRVAKRAAVGKSTLYLRWPDKDSLLADAVAQTASAVPDVDTGSLRGDLELLAENIHRFFHDPQGWAAFRISVDVAGSGEQVGGYNERVHATHRSATLDIVRRAIRRGELTTDVPSQTLIECLYGAIAMRRLVRPVLEPDLTEADPAEIVRPLVDFCMAGLGPWLREPGQPEA
jgi:AcrR family transcriptional regulator